MFALNLLGGAVLEGRNGPVTGRAAHKRRLALLAILAVARGRSVGRERIIGLLWPEHPTDAARHLLSESLYVLRKELGEDTFVSSGDEVGLNGEVVRSDVAEFERELQEGDPARAAPLYRGPFLDGFFVADAPEFERWAEAERDRLARSYTRLVEAIASDREAAGLPQEAADWWRRLAVQDPYNSRVGMRLMRALDASGERAAALWFADAHVALLREELGVDPDPDLLALIERLRSEPFTVPTPPPLPPARTAPPPPAAVPLDLPTPTPGAPPPAPSSATADGGAEVSAYDPSSDETPSAVPGAPPTPADGTTTMVVVPPARPGARWRSVTRAAALAGVLVGVAAGVLSGRTEEPAAPVGHDPRRIAVLYFDDHTRGGELGYLANGLTEMLIHELSQVEALEVISRNGVKPYREKAVRFDSLVADLKVGSVVEGSVQRSGDSVRVTVQLIDANTQAHLESRTLTYPLTEVFALEDALAHEVSSSLRKSLGREIALRETRAGTRSEPAWRMAQRAEQAMDEAAELERTGDPHDLASADRLLQRADSLLAVAEGEDGDWTHPTLLRGWVAIRRAAVRPAWSRALLDTALAYAGRVLAREPGSARALELRGTARFKHVLAAGAAGRPGAQDAAERDLRAAVAAEPGLAQAWGKLSQVLRYGGRFVESDLAARRALAEDAYLDEADDILNRLFFGALLTGDFPAARASCDDGRRRFSADWRFVECALTLLREDRDAPPDADRAMRLLAELDRLDPPARAAREGRAYSPVYRRAVAAAVLARAGRADSARSVLDRARRMAGDDEDLLASLGYDEAYARLLLGERAAARALLAGTLARRPALRPFAARDPLLREIVPPAAATGTPPAAGAAPSRRAP